MPPVNQPPPCPTPITVAAILVIVAASGPVLSVTGLVVGSLLLTGRPPAIATLIAIGLFVTLWWIAISVTIRLRAGRVENLNGLRRWVQNCSLVGGLISLPGLLQTASDVWFRVSPAPPEACLLLGAVCYSAICAVTGGIAAVAMDVHASEYDTWRDARLLREGEPGWEFADD